MGYKDGIYGTGLVGGTDSCPKMIRRLIGGGLAAPAGSTTYLYNYNDDFKRTCTLFKELGPVISHYRFVELKLKTFPKNSSLEDAEWQELHDKYSDKVMETLRDLRGFYIKVAQVMYYLLLVDYIGQIVRMIYLKSTLKN